ncbi:MAG TPA: hypothetical protein VKU02_26850 [Gemmataceae bacterium]|nr:hypothetical protein [Gemmataceae bacterium]
MDPDLLPAHEEILSYPAKGVPYLELATAVAWRGIDALMRVMAKVQDQLGRSPGIDRANRGSLRRREHRVKPHAPTLQDTDRETHRRDIAAVDAPTRDHVHAVVPPENGRRDVMDTKITPGRRPAGDFVIPLGDAVFVFIAVYVGR